MKRRHWLLALALGITLVLTWMAPDEVADPVEQRPQVVAKRANAPAQAPDVLTANIAPLLSRDDQSVRVRSALAFDARSWTPPPPPPPPSPPPAPTAPPLPFTYLGKKLELGAWEVFLERGERVVHLQERDIIDQWRVESIHENGMTFTYLPLKQAQTLTFGANSP
jgi:hypothetical protein